jgi:hypothetical protein
MSKGICVDCGMILPAATKTCTVCGFDNQEQQEFELPTVGNTGTEQYEEVAPENYPGF